MVEYAYKENGVMKLKPVALSLSQAEIDEIATELLEAMQPDWQNAVSLTAAQLQTGYVVPSNGYICLCCLINSNRNSSVTITVNGVGIAVAWAAANNTAYSIGQAQCQVNKGDIVRLVNDLNVPLIPYGYNPFNFVPFKTSNPVSLRPLDKTKIDASVVQHWDDITSDFSIPGSASGFVLSSVKYNPVLQQLKIIVKKTTSSAASTTFKLYLQYNGSEPIAFGDNTILLWNHVGPANGCLAGIEYGTAVVASNKFEIDTYNRNSSNAWAANDTFRGIIWL